MLCVIQLNCPTSGRVGMRRPLVTGLLAAGLLAAVTAGAVTFVPTAKLGRQPDGSFLVSSGQRIVAGTVAFDGRPIDLAAHPSGRFFVVLNKTGVFLADRSGVLAGSR